MTLRTPRRRISPRTKQRYRAIKNFLRKALGTSSRGDTLTNSTLGVSVSDLKNKIECIEQQLDRVSKHCQDIATLEETFRKESDNLATQENLEVEVQKPRKSNLSSKNLETNLLYKNSSKVNKKYSKNNDINERSHNAEQDMNSCESAFSNNATLKTKNKRNRKSGGVEPDQYYESHYIKSKNDKITRVYSTSSFHSLDSPKHRDYVNPGRSSPRQKQHRKKEYIEDAIPMDYKYEKYERSNKNRRNKREVTSYDEEFIADIIERQYKPVKLFGKRHSDFSQFSAPVCRDQEFRIRHDIQEGSELCSCCYDDNRRRKHRYIRNNDLSDMRSICDTRLYSSNENHNKKCRRYVDDYNNSAFYDVVPVKEKSSPKSRRKFADDNKMIYHFKEVPPSPRTQRPRLNLKVHNYDEYENSLVDVRTRSGKKLASLENYKQTVGEHDSDVSTKLQQLQNRRNEDLLKVHTQKSVQVHEQIETTSSLQVDPINISNNDTTINTQATDFSATKTDKALGEIKNILQSFLIEIKKESTHDENSNVTNRIENKTTSGNQYGTKVNGHTIPNSKPNMENNNHNMGNCGMPPFLPTFPSPCCYPIIPVCPMNCLQSGYMLHNPSFTCMACAKNSKENICHEKDSHNNKSNPSEVKTTDETQELIKEIYKFVSQKSKTPSKMGEYSPKNEGSGYEMRNVNKNLLTNRSVGSTKAFKHDANVGTPNMKCHSKSCEAIGSRIPSEGYTTNASYSDTVLDKLSLEASQSSTESDVSAEHPKKKGKQSPFKKVLRSLRLLRRKRDVIEEESENESTVEVNVKSKPPFKQHITNYSMHGQEYFHPPPIPEQFCCPPHVHKHPYNHDHRDSRNVPQHPMRNEFHDNCRQFYDPMHPLHRHPKNHYPSPLCPNYDPQYNQLHSPQSPIPQVPLCLKEIEVKSIATQSERKMSIFHKFAKKIQPPVRQDATQQYSAPPVQNKPTIWKSLQERAKHQNPDPMTFSLKTQKQLAQGDMKMRSAVLKKLFYKRNPFSPRNLIIRTLLGKDKSSFGDPPKMYRPRMFL